MKRFAIVLLLPILAVLAGCASQIGANQYDSAAVGSVNRVLKGTIVSVRQIKVADSDNSAGTAIGGIAGGAAGNLAQRGLSSQTGYEYVVQLDNGGLVTVTQGSDVLLGVGQRCMVLYGSGSDRARVVPYNGY